MSASASAVSNPNHIRLPLGMHNAWECIMTMNLWSNLKYKFSANTIDGSLVFKVVCFKSDIFQCEANTILVDSIMGMPIHNYENKCIVNNHIYLFHDIIINIKFYFYND